MSEFSESIHLRLDDSDKLKRTLRAQKLSGLMFGPANGWVTFVPYEDAAVLRRGATLDTIARQLSQALRSVVLRYRYAQDYGWGFLAIDAAGRESSFDCWWHAEPLVEDGMLDLGVLAQIGSIDSIMPLLQRHDLAAAQSKGPAYRFAETLGLQAFKWLAPDLVQHRTAEFLAHGGVKIGTKPRSAEARFRLPPARKIALPRADLSAREAYRIARPFLSSLSASWFLTCIFGDGYISEDGRLATGVGRWNFVHAKTGGDETISAYLYANGSFGFRVDTGAFRIGPSVSDVPLSGEWLDSTVIAEVVAREPYPGEEDKGHGLLMTLAPVRDLPLLWEVNRSRTKMRGKGSHSRHTLFVDAYRGDIVFEGFDQWQANKKIDARQRDRRSSSNWIPTRGSPE